MGRRTDLTRARERFLEGGTTDPDAVVRAEIAASWERSRAAGLDASRFEVPFVGDLDFDGSLVHCARPVLDDLAEKLSGMAVAVVLTDAEGHLLDRRVGEDELRRRLDAISLAPGFSYAEQFAGTNGVGTALSGAAPALVVGPEHFTDRLTPFACAGAPVHDPIGGLAGILDVTCLRDQASDLMRFLARQAARDISEAMRERGSFGARAVMVAFRAACARHDGPVLAVAHDFVIANRAAREGLSAPERDAIAARAAEGVRAGTEERILLADGPARVVYTTVPAGRPGGVVAEVVRSTSTLRLASASMPPSPALEGSGRAPGAAGGPRLLPGLAGTSSSWRAVAAALRSAAAESRSVVVLGETGVGKTVAVRAAHRELRPTARWVVIDAGEPEAADTLASLPATVGSGPATVVVRRLETLGRVGADALAEMLEDVPSQWWIVGVVTGESVAPTCPVHAVIAEFAASVVVEPLRRRPDDIPLLAAALLARLAPGRRVRLTPAAEALLTGALWAGNVHELTVALRHALAARPAGDLESGDLPGEVAAHGTRRRLSPIEAAERDLIVDALVQAGGNRCRAATALGLGRSTLYRRLRAFGLTDVGR